MGIGTPSSVNGARRSRLTRCDYAARRDMGRRCILARTLAWIRTRTAIRASAAGESTGRGVRPGAVDPTSGRMPVVARSRRRSLVCAHPRPLAIEPAAVWCNAMLCRSLRAQRRELHRRPGRCHDDSVWRKEAHPIVVWRVSVLRRHVDEIVVYELYMFAARLAEPRPRDGFFDSGFKQRPDLCALRINLLDTLDAAVA